MKEIKINPSVEEILQEFADKEYSGIVTGEKEAVFEFMRLYAGLIKNNKGITTVEREPELRLKGYFPTKDILSLNPHNSKADEQIFKTVTRLSSDYMFLTFEPDVGLVDEIYHAGVSVIWCPKFSSCIPKDLWSCLSKSNKEKIAKEDFEKQYKFMVSVVLNKNELGVSFIG